MSCKKNIKYVMVNIDKLIRQGAHYGQFSNIGHPQTRKFLYGSTSVRNNQVIDLVQTGLSLQKARNLIHQVSIARGTILLVATEDPMSTILSRLGDKYPIHYVNTKWIGGMLTNWKTVSTRIERLKKLEQQEQDGIFDLLPKKEVASTRKELEKLRMHLNGIKDMPRTPDVMIVVDQRRELTAIKEAMSLNIPVISLSLVAIPINLFLTINL